MSKKIICPYMSLLVSIFIIYSTPVSAQPSFTKHIIDDNFVGAYTAIATDIDGDGNIDILGGAQRSSVVAWWRNDGRQNFTKYIIDPHFSYVWCIKAADLDSDGDIDVVGASCGNGELAWWENDGDENFTKHFVDDNFETAESVYAIDVDDDGDMDVVGAATYPADIAWYENDGNQNFTKHIIDDNFISAHAMYADDVDGDGDVDVLGAATNQRNIVWWENDGNENFSGHTISSGFGGAYCVYTNDVDSDGDVDILGAAHVLSQIAWWENGGHENFRMHIIEENFPETHYVYAADIDVDGDIDVLGSSRENDQVAWWENDGDEYFTKHILDDNFDGAHSVHATDIDGDGDTDILATALWGHEIAWWENNMPPISYAVSGNVYYYSNGVPVNDVTLTIGGEISSTESTDAEGKYYFKVSKSNSFTVTPYKPSAQDAGETTITTYDAALVARHVLHLDTLNRLQQIVADTDMDGNIHIYDAVLICHYVLQLTKLSSSHIGDWLFEPDSRNYQELSSDQKEQDYTGLIIGNVHGGWSQPGPLNKMAPVSRYYKNLTNLEYAKEKIIIPLTVESGQNILSADIEFGYNQQVLEFIEISKTELSQNSQIFYTNKNGWLKVCMYSVEPVNKEGILLKLVFKVKESKRNNTFLHLKRFKLNNDVTMYATTLASLVEIEKSRLEFVLNHNYPNPFNSWTWISYQIPQSVWVSLKIYNLSGQEVKTLVEEEKQAGFYQVIWDGKNNMGQNITSGIYIYQLIIKNDVISKKLIKID